MMLLRHVWQFDISIFYFFGIYVYVLTFESLVFYLGISTVAFLMFHMLIFGRVGAAKAAGCHWGIVHNI